MTLKKTLNSFGYFDYTVSEPTLLVNNSTDTNASTPYSNDGSIIFTSHEKNIININEEIILKDV